MRLFISFTYFASVVSALLLPKSYVLAQEDIRELVDESLGYATLAGLGTRDIREVVFLIINILLGFLAIIATLLILSGGFKWMVSGGNEDKVVEAKRTIISGIIGMVIIFVSYALAAFVVRSLVNITAA